METREARLYKALDKMEAVIQHNESDIIFLAAAGVRSPADLRDRKREGVSIFKRITRTHAGRYAEKD